MHLRIVDDGTGNVLGELDVDGDHTYRDLLVWAAEQYEDWAIRRRVTTPLLIDLEHSLCCTLAAS